eukprot:TRINITY_DN9726_c0_g1_i1.p2 TRINITY_DN9726_c0_g1~~TRINITY_DN9726_c0_g1_i1.p2  ORF type:complete len:340 (-),score=48.44 TRINITY_DN9726_c0_g1_i1:93-1034(-)
MDDGGYGGDGRGGAPPPMSPLTPRRAGHVREMQALRRSVPEAIRAARDFRSLQGVEAPTPLTTPAATTTAGPSCGLAGWNRRPVITAPHSPRAPPSDAGRPRRPMRNFRKAADRGCDGGCLASCLASPRGGDEGSAAPATGASSSSGSAARGVASPAWASQPASSGALLAAALGAASPRDKTSLPFEHGGDQVGARVAQDADSGDKSAAHAKARAVAALQRLFFEELAKGQDANGAAANALLRLSDPPPATLQPPADAAVKFAGPTPPAQPTPQQLRLPQNPVSPLVGPPERRRPAGRLAGAYRLADSVAVRN